MTLAEHIVIVVLEDEDDEMSVKGFASDPYPTWVKIDKRHHEAYGPPFYCTVCRMDEGPTEVSGYGNTPEEARLSFVRHAVLAGYRLNPSNVRVEYETDHTVSPIRTGSKIF